MVRDGPHGHGPTNSMNHTIIIIQKMNLVIYISMSMILFYILCKLLLLIIFNCQPES